MPTDPVERKVQHIADTSENAVYVNCLIGDCGCQTMTVDDAWHGDGVPMLAASIINECTREEDITTEEALREVVECLNKMPTDPNSPLPVEEMINDE